MSNVLFLSNGPNTDTDSSELSDYIWVCVGAERNVYPWLMFGKTFLKMCMFVYLIYSDH